jgi:hypothetical protein
LVRAKGYWDLPVAFVFYPGSAEFLDLRSTDQVGIQNGGAVKPRKASIFQLAFFQEVSFAFAGLGLEGLIDRAKAIGVFQWRSCSIWDLLCFWIGGQRTRFRAKNGVYSKPRKPFNSSSEFI